jgi:hypothetical protein
MEPFKCQSWTYHELLALCFHGFLFAWGQANIQVWGYLIREFLACIFFTIHAWFLNILDILHKKIRMLNLFLNYWPRGKLMCFQILGYWTGRARQWNWTVIHYVLQKKLYNLVPDVCHHFQIAEMKVYKTYEGHITQFCCFEAQKTSWKTRIEPARNSCTAKTVSVYGPYLNAQRSKNCKINFVGKKIWFSTISPEIEIFEFAPFLPQIWPAMSG